MSQLCCQFLRHLVDIVHAVHDRVDAYAQLAQGLRLVRRWRPRCCRFSRRWTVQNGRLLDILGLGSTLHLRRPAPADRPTRMLSEMTQVLDCRCHTSSYGPDDQRTAPPRVSSSFPPSFFAFRSPPQKLAVVRHRNAERASRTSLPIADTTPHATRHSEISCKRVVSARQTIL